MEDGEHPEEALRREVWEELGVQVAVEEPLTFAWHRDEVKTVLLLFYRAAIREGSPRGREGQEVGWFTRQQLRDLPVPPADRHLVQLLVGE